MNRTETMPFLYAVMSGRMHIVKLYDGLTFGASSMLKHYDLELPTAAGKMASGLFKSGGEGKWYVQCTDRSFKVNGQTIKKNQYAALGEGCEIRLAGGREEPIADPVFFVFSESDAYQRAWMQTDFAAAASNDGRLSGMANGDCRWIAGRLLIRLGSMLLYQNEGSATSASAQGVKPSASAPAQKLDSHTGHLDIDIREVTVGGAFRNKTILKDVHLSMEAGQMVMLLGGSGAGKSTFMESVTGLRTSKTEVRFGGRDLLHDQEARSVFCLVPQDPQFRMDDTVYHTLDDAAILNAPPAIAENRDRREARVREILGMMDLEKVGKHKCASLSGGQKKKLSIALEYIAEPRIMFLDEPDSGVDGPMVDEIIDGLRKIADEGRILCMITHSPDRIRDRFDKIAVIAKSSEDCGRLAFYGSVRDTLRYFDCSTLEEVVAKVSDRPDYKAGPVVDQYVSQFEKLRGGR